MEKSEEEILEALQRLGIEYEIKEHEPFFTMDAYLSIEREMGLKVPKNLLLRTQNEKRVRTKEISKEINTSRLSFAKEEELEGDLHCFKGSTSLLGLYFDKDKKVRLLIDEDLLKEEFLGFHPCVNTSTLKLRTKDLLDIFLPSISHSFSKVKISGA